MKKILALMAFAIALPTMAQTMYDGKSCEEWKNEYDNDQGLQRPYPLPCFILFFQPRSDEVSNYRHRDVKQ